jgi:hypothetical protein
LRWGNTLFEISFLISLFHSLWIFDRMNLNDDIISIVARETRDSSGHRTKFAKSH